MRFCTEPCPPALPPCYRDGPTLPPRDLRLEWFEALGAALAWERTAGLFTFRGDVVGGFEDLIQLEGWGRMLLRPFVERPEYAHVANVLVLDRSPGVRLVNPRFGSLTAGADRGVPVLDRRTDPGEWQPPWEPNPGWEPERLRPHVLDEVDALRFCRDVAATLAEGEDLAPFLARCALVYRAPGDHLRPGAVLRRLIDSIWETIRDVSIRDRLTTPSPPRPPSTAPVLDQFHAAFDALGNWLRETRRLHPDYVDEAYARMGELATGPVCAVTECEPGQPEDWRAAVDRLVAGIRCDRPRDVDPALADAFEAVAVAVRECSRLVAAAPYLWDRPDDYRELAAAAGEAVGRARGAAWAVDIRLRRAGEPNAVLAALQDALDIRALGRVDSNGIRPVV